MPDVRVLRAGLAPTVGVSLTHSGVLACAAVTRGAVVGVDLETGPMPSSQAFLQEAFAEGELEGFAHFPEGPGGDVVRLAWTLKEAVLKVWGVGLRAPLGQVRVVPGAALWRDGGLHYEVDVEVGPLPEGLPPPPGRLSCVTLPLEREALLTVALVACSA